MKDYFKKDANELLNKKLYLFDMDGTIYRENTLFDGVLDLLAQIKKAGGNFAFITNNPTKSVKDYIKKLNKLGILNINKSNFFTSAQASILVIKEKFGSKLIYAQGTKSFIKELKDNGVNLTTKYDEKIKAILVSFDTEITGEKMRTTSKVLSKLNVPYYATNPDWVCPVEFGSIPDCGSMCFGYEKATGRLPIYIGKPEPTMILEIMKKFGATKEETVVIGDRLYTDIASGNNAGVDTILVLSGEATLNDLTSSIVKPTYVLNSVKDLIK